jgi:hypothetical protein
MRNSIELRSEIAICQYETPATPCYEYATDHINVMTVYWAYRYHEDGTLFGAIIGRRLPCCDGPVLEPVWQALEGGMTLRSRIVSIARDLNQPVIGPELVLLAIIEGDDPEGVSSVLKEEGIAREAVLRIIPTVEDSGAGILWNPAAQILLGTAKGISIARGNISTTDSDLLVAFCYDNYGMIPHLLNILGSDPGVILNRLAEQGYWIPTVDPVLREAVVFERRRILISSQERAAVFSDIAARSKTERLKWGWNENQDGQTVILGDPFERLLEIVADVVGPTGIEVSND